MSFKNGVNRTRAGAGISDKDSRQYMGLVWMLPAFLLIAVFSVYPPLSAFFYSFTDWNGAVITSFGVSNFVKLAGDAVFYKSFLNMLILTGAGIILGNAMTILLAELLYNLRSKIAGGIYRFLFVIPALIPGIVTLLLWGKIILSGDANSLMNLVMRLLGLPTKSWLYGESTVLFSMLLFGFPWVGGTSFLIYLAGLNNIPDSVMEAAKMDGVPLLKRIFVIDFPLIKGQLKYFLVLGVIGGLQNYSLQYAITKGGPGMNNASNVPGYYMYSEALNYSRYGYACAIGLVMFIVILALTVVNNKLLNTSEDAMS